MQEQLCTQQTECEIEREGLTRKRQILKPMQTKTITTWFNPFLLLFPFFAPIQLHFPLSNTHMCIHMCCNGLVAVLGICTWSTHIFFVGFTFGMFLCRSRLHSERIICIDASGSQGIWNLAGNSIQVTKIFRQGKLISYNGLKVIKNSTYYIYILFNTNVI